MIWVREATVDEVKAVTPDILCPYSRHRYVAEKGGEVVAVFGVADNCLVGRDGYPWFHWVPDADISLRELVQFSKAALSLWSEEYDNLFAVAEKGQNEAWFRFLGFRVDRERKPFYADGRTMVYMRYTHGRPDHR